MPGAFLLLRSDMSPEVSCMLWILVFMSFILTVLTVKNSDDDNYPPYAYV